MPRSVQIHTYWLFVLVVVSACDPSAPAQPDPQPTPDPPATSAGSWRSTASLPEGSAYSRAVGHGGYVYVVGGGRRSPWESHNRAYRYDPQTNQWERLPDFPVSTFRPAVFVHGDRLLAGAGSSTFRNFLGSHDSIYAWDEASFSWQPHSRLPQPTTDAVSAGTQDHGFIFNMGHGVGPSDSAGWLPPQATEWASSPAPPIHARHAAAANGQVWAFSDDGAIARFDVQAGTWDREIAIPSSRDVLWVIGAWAHDQHAHVLVRVDFSDPEHHIWDHAAQRWSETAVPAGANDWAQSAQAYLNGDLYLIGGYDNNSLDVLSKVAVFSGS